MSAIADLEPLHRLTSAEYHRLVESGGLGEDAHVELLDGLLLAMSPKSREHEQALSALVAWLAPQIDFDAFELRVAAPLSLADGTEPEPDVAVVARPTARPYHPASAALVVEVAVSSQRRDLVVKVEAYAAAGVPVYLVVDVGARRAVSHRDPAGRAYRDVREVDVLDTGLARIAPLAVADVLAAASR